MQLLPTLGAGCVDLLSDMVTVDTKMRNVLYPGDYHCFPGHCDLVFDVQQKRGIAMTKGQKKIAGQRNFLECWLKSQTTNSDTKKQSIKNLEVFPKQHVCSFGMDKLRQGKVGPWTLWPLVDCPSPQRFLFCFLRSWPADFNFSKSDTTWWQTCKIFHLGKFFFCFDAPHLLRWDNWAAQINLLRSRCILIGITDSKKSMEVSELLIFQCGHQSFDPADSRIHVTTSSMRMKDEKQVLAPKAFLSCVNSNCNQGEQWEQNPGQTAEKFAVKQWTQHPKIHV